MKIGILTYHAPCNFGANLQAYSSVRFFQLLGHEVKVINYLIKEDIDPKNCAMDQIVAHRLFSQNTLPVTSPVHDGREIYEVVKKECFDVIAIGADAVWNKKDRERLAVFYASWLWNTDLENKVKVIALSPAFMGTTYSDLTPDEKANFRKGILNFTFPDVRDEWTMDIVNREIMGCDYIKTINPDPVFLLNELCTDRWNPIWKDVKSKNYYIITLPAIPSGRHSENIKKWLGKLRKELNNRGYKLIELPLPDGATGYQEYDYTVPYPIDPLQWFLWLKNAKGYIGLRFHAVVSCLTAGTPFFSLDIYGNVPRWLNYLNRLGIHKFDRQLNKRSKIRNLLEGSGLENYRMNGIYVDRLNPKRLIDKLESCETKKIVDFRDKKIAIFKKNMNEALYGPLSQANK